MVITEVDIGLTPANFYANNHGGLNISHLRFTQTYIPRGVHGENLHKNHPYYSYPSIPTHPHTSMPPHTNHHMPPHIYPSITPHQFCLCPYCTSTTIYVTYVVTHYPHIPSLGYIYTLSSRLPSPVLTHNSSNKISEYRIETSNRISNKEKKKQIASTIRTDG